jgi:hypothetical protein
LSHIPATDSTAVKTKPVAPNIPFELAVLKADVKAAREKFNTDGDGTRASMMAIFEEKVIPHCDGAEENIAFYRKFLDEIVTGKLKDMHAFAKRIPKFIGMSDDQIRAISVDDMPTYKPGQPSNGGRGARA